MFNPDNYGEEEFGPDDPKAKVKKTRKKKKVTNAGQSHRCRFNNLAMPRR